MAQLDAMQPEPTMWEVVRRLDELASGQKEIKESLDDKYVRKDVYEAEGETKEKISDNTKQRLGILEYLLHVLSVLGRGVFQNSGALDLSGV
jgi:hypothetical protein